MKNIYITIATAEEPFLEQTILSAQKNASGKNNLFFKVFNQSDKNEILNLDHLNVNLELINYLSDSLHGLGKARMVSNCTDLTMADYVLQIDSHMIFSKNWDDYLIEYLSFLKKEYEKSLISGYLMAWMEKNGKICVGDKEIDYLNFDCDTEKIFYGDIPVWSVIPPEVLRSRLHVDSRSAYPMGGAVESFDKNEKFKEIYCVAGNFIFAEKELFEEMIHDPWIFWGGDEIVYSMRIWTRGYKIFALDKPVVLHQDKDDWTKLKNDWRMHYDFNRLSIKDFGFIRMKNILLGKILGYWGSPSLEKLKEYEYAIKFNFNDFYKNNNYILDEEILKKNKYNDRI